MDTNEELVRFVEWAIMMGCPPNVIPSYCTLQTTLRARSIIVMDMIEKVRPRIEVERYRDNILLNRMQKFRDKDLPISVRSFVPEKYQRYDKITECNRKIEETSEKLDRIKLQCTKVMERVKDKNIKKMKLRKMYDDALTKQKMIEAKHIMLLEQVELIKRNDNNFRKLQVVIPEADNMDESRCICALMQAKVELENFYKSSLHAKPANRDAIAAAKQKLLLSVRSILGHFPNLLLFKTLSKQVEHELAQLMTQYNHMPNFKDQKQALEDQLMKTISDAYQKFVQRSTQLKSETESLRSLTENYEQLYTSMNREVDERFCGIRLPQLKEDFIRESVRLHFNDGRIKFIQSELQKNKELVKQRICKLNDMNRTVDSIKDVCKNCQSDIANMVGDMKQLQKINGQLLNMRDITEKHLKILRSDLIPHMKIREKLGNKCKKNPCMEYFHNPPPTCRAKNPCDETMIDELKLFEEMPIAYLNSIDHGQLWRRYAPIYFYKSEVLRTSRMAHLLTVGGFLKEIQSVCHVHSALSKVSKKRDFNMISIKVDVEEIRKREVDQLIVITDIFQAIDTIFEEIDELMEKCKKYYNFLMTSPLKHYYPSSIRVEGRTFNAFENEYSLYYRMIRGSDKVHESMD